jgi:hypothetical protein
MFERHPADYLLAGILIGGYPALIITWCVLWGTARWSWLSHVLSWQCAIVAFILTALVTLWRPLMLRTVLRERRDPFIFDVDLNQALLGRSIGIGMGVCAAFALQMMPQ